MHLLIIVAVLATISASETSSRAVASPGASLLQVSGICLASCLAVLSICLGTARAIRRQSAREALWLRGFLWLKWSHGPLWLVSCLLILYVCQWSAVVKQNWNLQAWPLIDDLLIFAPLIAPLLVSWLAFFEVERALEVVDSTDRPGNNYSISTPLTLPSPPRGRGSCGSYFLDDPTSRNAAPRPETRGRYLLTHAQHYLLLILGPTLLLLSCQDLTRWCFPHWSRQPQETLLCLTPLTLLLVFSPLLTRYVWSTQALPPGPLRNSLLQWAARAQIGFRDILVWNTNSRTLNAAVIGLFPAVRYVLLSDSLTQTLSPRQIESVFLHEAGHVRRRHSLLRISILLLPPALWIAWTCWFSPAPDCLTMYLSWLGVAPTWQQGVLFPLGYVIYVVLALGYCSRVLEHEADLEACCCLSHQTVAENATAEAVQLLSETLLRIAEINGHCTAQRGWLHPSIRQRIRFLRRLEKSSGRQAEFAREMKALRIGVYGLLVAAACSAAASLIVASFVIV